jgi:hypothetical protein
MTPRYSVETSSCVPYNSSFMMSAVARSMHTVGTVTPPVVGWTESPPLRCDQDGNTSHPSRRHRSRHGSALKRHQPAIVTSGR